MHKLFLKIERNPWMLLLGVILVFLAVQSVFLGHRWVDDESWYTMPVPSILNEGAFRIPTIPGDDRFWPQPPILTYLESLIERCADLNAVTARTIPLAAGVLLILTVYFLAGRMFQNRTIALLAAFFVASDNMIFLAARIVRPEILIALFTVAALLFFEMYRQKDFAKRWMCLSGLMCALSICSHPNGLMTPCIIGLAILMNVDGWKKKISGCVLLGVFTAVFLLPFAGWIAYHDGPHQFESFKSHWLGRHGRYVVEHQSSIQYLGSLLANEFHQRYASFIQFPFRAHIAAGFVLTLVASLVSRRKEVRFLSVAIIAYLLFFIFVNNSNPSARYIANLMPLMCLLWAYWSGSFLQRLQTTTNAGNKILSTVMVVFLIGGMGASQFAGNLLYLWKFRKADYTQVTRELREIIPAGSTVYGSMSFWMGLKDYAFVPYIRTKWKEAVERHDPDIVIMDDWVMTGGGIDGEWLRLKESIELDLERRGTLIGEVHNSFYGNLKIYSVNHSL